jgi:hypothetical protein
MNYGYIQDSPAHRLRQKSSRLLLGTAATSLPAVSLRPYEPNGFPLDQNKTGSCGGHGTSAGIAISFEGAGIPLAFIPSPKSIYSITRQSALSKPGTALTDSGVMPADVMATSSTFGIRAMTAPSPQGFHSDVDPSNVNQTEDLLELEQAGQKIVVGEYRIDETASDFLDQVRLSLAAKVAVGLGIFVDTSFQEWTNGDPPLDSVNLNDPNGGGHWICCVGYDTTQDFFELLNSWGPSFGDAGHIRVSSAWMQAAVSDCYAINVARKS